MTQRTKEFISTAAEALDHAITTLFDVSYSAASKFLRPAKSMYMNRCCSPYTWCRLPTRRHFPCLFMRYRWSVLFFVDRQIHRLTADVILPDAENGQFCSQDSTTNSAPKCKLKQSEVSPYYRPRGPLRGQQRYSSTLFLEPRHTRWIRVVNTTPGRLYPRERPGTHCTESWVGLGAGLDKCGKSRPHRDSIPGPSSP
jgi:hypothetical protein